MELPSCKYDLVQLGNKPLPEPMPIKCLCHMAWPGANELTLNGTSLSGLILGLRPTNERRRYFVTTSLIGWAQDENQPWK